MLIKNTLIYSVNYKCNFNINDVSMACKLLPYHNLSDKL